MANPYCLAMVICDGVHRDPATNKFTILGTFSSFAAHSYPSHLRFWIYFAVTDGIGPVTLRFQLIDAEAGIIDAQDDGDAAGRVFALKLETEFPSPFAVVESALGIGADLPKPGQYHCELWADNELLMSRRLIAGLIDTDSEECEG
jgi:hypothetical protein